MERPRRQHTGSPVPTLHLSSSSWSHKGPGVCPVSQLPLAQEFHRAYPSLCQHSAGGSWGEFGSLGGFLIFLRADSGAKRPPLEGIHLVPPVDITQQRAHPGRWVPRVTNAGPPTPRRERPVHAGRPTQNDESPAPSRPAPPIPAAAAQLTGARNRSSGSRTRSLFYLGPWAAHARRGPGHRRRRRGCRRCCCCCRRRCCCCPRPCRVSGWSCCEDWAAAGQARACSSGIVTQTRGPPPAARCRRLAGRMGAECWAVWAVMDPATGDRGKSKREGRGRISSPAPGSFILRRRRPEGCPPAPLRVQLPAAPCATHLGVGTCAQPWCRRGYRVPSEPLLNVSLGGGSASTQR